MSVLIYRNKLNKEMRGFSRFGRYVSERLNKKGIPIQALNEEDIYECYKVIREHDTIIFIAHGSEDAIYHRYETKPGNAHKFLISESNLDVLKGKKVIAISCGTARVLAPKACDQGGCISYLGFKNKIHFSKSSKHVPSDRYRVFIGNCYKDTFANVLEMAIENRWSFSKLKKVLERELKRTVVQRAADNQHDYPKWFEKHGIRYSVLAVSNVAENIMIFGDGNAQVS